MGEDWIAGAREALRAIEKLASKKDKDRLDLINLLTASLRAMERSIMGWFQWVLNPSIMGQFSKEELEEVSENIRRMAEEFVKYDVEVTERYARKMPRRVEQRGPEQLYV
jgi:hypothetical protein